MTICERRNPRPTAIALVTIALLSSSILGSCGGGSSSDKRSGPVEMIAFEDGEGIAAVQPDGSGMVRISDHKSPGTDGGFFGEGGYFDSSPAWSPTGDRIAFISRRDGNAEVYIADADGSNHQNVTDHPSDDGGFGFAWSPDGQRIAFVSDREGATDLYSVSIDGSDLLNLTRGRATPAGWAISATEQVSWSPDGKRVAFAAQNKGINVVNADGSRHTVISRLHPASMEDQEGNVTGTVDVSLDMAPRWSLGGENIAYLVGAGELHVMRSDGTGDTWITGGSKGTEVNHFAWSPEGKRIAFSPIGGPISVTNSDGSCTTQLSDGDAGWGDWPSWSPDGRRIAFAANRQGNIGLFVMNDDGSGQVSIANGDPGGVASVTWSPVAGTTADREMDCEGRTPGSQPASPEGYVEQEPYGGNCQARPTNSWCIGFDDGYVWLLSDGFEGWDWRGEWQGKQIQVFRGVNADYYHILGTQYVREEPK